MRESTMYFLKQVFNKNQSIQDEDDFYTTMKKQGGLSPGGASRLENPNSEFESVNTPGGIFRSRRSTNKSLLNILGSTKENESPERRMNRHMAGDSMSNDIQSLIKSFHQDTQDFKEGIIHKTSQK